MRCEGHLTCEGSDLPDFAAYDMGDFGLAGEHKNNLDNAIPSKVVAGRGCEVPHRHLTILQLQDLNLIPSDEGRTPRR